MSQSGSVFRTELWSAKKPLSRSGRIAMATNLASIEAIFNGALAPPSAEARAAYLDRVCAADPELRRQVESLIAAHDRAGRFLASPTVSYESGSPEPVGSIVGPYKLMEQIGEGGMGVV